MWCVWVYSHAKNHAGDLGPPQVYSHAEKNHAGDLGPPQVYSHAKYHAGDLGPPHVYSHAEKNRKRQKSGNGGNISRHSPKINVQKYLYRRL